MNPGTFFEKFEQFSEAPNAVAKLRELVLQLAVQGKLVEQKKDEGHADSLLKRIKNEKARLVKERMIRKQDTDPIGKDEELFSIPKSWVWTRLGEIGDWGSGSTPSRGNYDLYGGGITWLKSGELNDNQALADSEETVTELAIKTGSFRMNRPGDILIAMYGATIGKAAILAKPAVTNQAICGCTPFEGVSNLYLFNYLLAQRARFHSASEGGAQPNISKVKIVGFPFPLPPLAEQKRIVAKVDELMALCDRLETQQQERDTRHATLARASLAHFADAHTPDNLDFLFHNSYTITPADLRKTILTLAVQGKLVPQDANDETAVDSLRLCGAKKTQQPVSDEEQRHTVPDSWTWMRFSDVGKQRLGKMLDAQKNRGELKPYLRNTNVQWMRFELDDVKAMRIEKSEADELRLKKGDLLICEGGEPGRCAIWNKDVSEMYFQKALHRVRPCAAIISEFLALNLQVDCQNEVLARYFTGATIKHLTGRSLSEYPVPIPPLAEQHRIVARVDQLMALVDQLETQLATSRATATNLMEAVIAELTAQE